MIYIMYDLYNIFPSIGLTVAQYLSIDWSTKSVVHYRFKGNILSQC